MKFETEYEIGQKIAIIALDKYPALLAGIRIHGKNVYYAIEYWLNSEKKYVELFENEICKL